MVLSRLPLAKILPSLLKQMLVIPFKCPLRVLINFPSFINESITFQDQDIYTFSIASTGQSDNFIGVLSDSNKIDLILELYGQSGNLIQKANDSNQADNIEVISLAGLSAGNYTAKVYDLFNGQYINNAAPYFLGIKAPQANPAGVKIEESNGGTSLSEAGTTDSYTVVLTSQPTSNVTINIAPDNQSTTTPTSLVFTTSNWNTLQTVTVTAVNDAVVEGSHTTTINHTVVSADSKYNGIAVDKVVAAIADNDSKLIVIQNSGNINVTEGGTSVSNAYFVQLTSAPTSNVTVTINTDGQSTVNSSTICRWVVDFLIILTLHHFEPILFSMKYKP